MIKKIIKNYIYENNREIDIIKVGYIKEIIQTYILSFIYENKKYKDLIFYGGTSLRFLFNLNRLSEDLDFIGENFSDFDELAKDLQKYFKKNHNLDLDYKLQKFRIILKFRNFLKDYNLSYGKSNDLYLKVEISDNFSFCKHFDIKKYPIFKFGEAIVINSLTPETLFSTKINAILHRKWTKIIGNTQVIMKGRDIYDLFWYLSNSYKINMNCIDTKLNKQELIIFLKEIITKINFKNISLDIENFIENENILDFFITGGREYILENLDKI